MSSSAPLQLTSQQTCMLLHNLKQLYSQRVAWQIVEAGAEQRVLPDVTVNLWTALGKEHIFQVNHVLQRPAFRIHPQQRSLVVYESQYDTGRPEMRVLYEYEAHEKVPEDKPVVVEGGEEEKEKEEERQEDERDVAETNSGDTKKEEKADDTHAASAAAPSSPSSFAPQETCRLLLRMREEFSGEIAWKIAEIGLMQYVPSTKIATALYNLLGEEILLHEINPLIAAGETSFKKVEKFNVMVFRQLDGKERILKLENSNGVVTDRETTTEGRVMELSTQVLQDGDDVSDITNMENEDDMSFNIEEDFDYDDDDDDDEDYEDDSTALPSSSSVNWEEPERRRRKKFARALKYMVWGSTKFVVQRTATCLYMSLVGPMTRKRLTNFRRRFLKQGGEKDRRPSVSQIESVASMPYATSQEYSY